MARSARDVTLLRPDTMRESGDEEGRTRAQTRHTPYRHACVTRTIFISWAAVPSRQWRSSRPDIGRADEHHPDTWATMHCSHCCKVQQPGRTPPIARDRYRRRRHRKDLQRSPLPRATDQMIGKRLTVGQRIDGRMLRPNHQFADPANPDHASLRGGLQIELTRASAQSLP